MTTILYKKKNVHTVYIYVNYYNMQIYAIHQKHVWYAKQSTIKKDIGLQSSNQTEGFQRSQKILSILHISASHSNFVKHYHAKKNVSFLSLLIWVSGMVTKILSPSDTGQAQLDLRHVRYRGGLPRNALQINRK